MPDEQIEPQVTDDGLGRALDELLKAADATDLTKGATHSGQGSNSIETGGRVDEDGASSGGLASDSDRGGIDTLMVAKMVDAGIPADVVDAFVGFMNGDDEEEEEEGDEEEEDDDDEVTVKVGKMRSWDSAGSGRKRGFIGKARKSEGYDFRKSMDQYRDDSVLADTIDVSPFLEALTARTADQLDAIRKSAMAFEGQQNFVNQKIAAALHQIGHLVKSQTQVVQALGERLQLVERQPAPQRGVTQLSGAKPLSKALPGEAGASSGGQLRKSEILSTLSYMNLEKGVKQINGRSTVELIGLFEGGNVIDEQTVGAVQTFLQTHPNEADAARQYS